MVSARLASAPVVSTRQLSWKRVKRLSLNLSWRRVKLKIYANQLGHFCSPRRESSGGHLYLNDWASLIREMDIAPLGQAGMSSVSLLLFYADCFLLFTCLFFRTFQFELLVSLFLLPDFYRIPWKKEETHLESGFLIHNSAGASWRGSVQKLAISGNMNFDFSPRLRIFCTKTRTIG